MAETSATVTQEELAEGLELLQQWQNLKRSDSDAARRCFIVEFAGMPKAGKSGAIRMLRHTFSHGYKLAPKRLPPYKVYTPAEGVSHRTPQQIRDDLCDYNCWAGAYGLQELIRAAHDDYHDITILDRGPWDASCWLAYASRNGSNDPRRDSAGAAAFFGGAQWATRADLHVVLVVQPVEAARRDGEDRLFQHGGFSSDENAMRAMSEIYDHGFQELQLLKAKHCSDVGNLAALLIDTTDKGKKAVATTVIRRIFEVLRARLSGPTPSKAFEFSVGWFEKILEPMLGKVRGSRELVEQLGPAVELANKLGPERRARVAEKIKEAAQLSSQFVSARAPKDEVVTEVFRMIESESGQ